MNPLLREAIGAIVRWALTFIAAWLVSHGVWSEPDAVKYVAELAGAITLGLGVLGWSLWQKYRSRLKLVMAMGSQGRMTESQVERAIADPRVDTPSVTTPKNEVPR